MNALKFTLLLSGFLGQPLWAETACHSLMNGLEEMTEAKKSDLYQLLFAHSPVPAELVSALTKQYPVVAKMFENEVKDGVSLRQQAEKRLGIVNRQYALWEAPERRSETLRAVVRLTAVLLNIGMGMEETTGDSSTRFSGRVLREILQHLGFNDQSIKMSEFLARNMVISRLIEDQVSPTRALSEFVGLVRIPALPFPRALRSQVLLSIADRLSQPGVDESQFAEKNGRLEPVSEKFEEFKRLTDL